MSFLCLFVCGTEQIALGQDKIALHLQESTSDYCSSLAITTVFTKLFKISLSVLTVSPTVHIPVV